MTSDGRNPYAYVPTRSDVERLAQWLGQLREADPGGALEPAVVVGTGYWPLPWYLRSFEKIGYLQTPPPGVDDLPLVFAMPDSSDLMMELLGESHACLPRGLRHEVPLLVFVRNDIWKTWMQSDTQ